MYSNNRVVSIEFSILISSMRDPQGKYCNKLSNRCVFRHQGVPELVKIMNRCRFIDMSNKLAATSHARIGHEKERKHWNSRRAFYKTLLTYVFQGMNLTPNAQAVVQHVTPWDHEFAATCMKMQPKPLTRPPSCTLPAGRHKTTQSFATICQQ